MLSRCWAARSPLHERLEIAFGHSLDRVRRAGWVEPGPEDQAGHTGKERHRQARDRQYPQASGRARRGFRGGNEDRRGRLTRLRPGDPARSSRRLEPLGSGRRCRAPHLGHSTVCPGWSSAVRNAVWHLVQRTRRLMDAPGWATSEDGNRVPSGRAMPKPHRQAGSHGKWLPGRGEAGRISDTIPRGGGAPAERPGAARPRACLRSCRGIGPPSRPARHRRFPPGRAARPGSAARGQSRGRGHGAARPAGAASGHREPRSPALLCPPSERRQARSSAH